MISQHGLALRFGADRKQAITWANVSPDIDRDKLSLGHNDSCKMHQLGTTLLNEKCYTYVTLDISMIVYVILKKI